MQRIQLKLVQAHHRVLNWDLRWCIRLNHYAKDRRVLAVFKGVSRLGDGWIWAGLSLLILIIHGAMVLEMLAHTLVTGAVGALIYKILKQKTLRPRPYQVHQMIRLGERPLDHFSFPSGHTLHAVLYTILFGVAFPVLLVFLVPFMVMVALSRIVLGLHYPTDVIVGAVLGVVLALTALGLPL